MDNVDNAFTIWQNYSLRENYNSLESVHNWKVIEIYLSFEFHRYANCMTTKWDGGLYSEGHLWTLSAVKVTGGQMQRHFNALWLLYLASLNSWNWYDSLSVLGSHEGTNSEKKLWIINKTS